MSSSTTWKSKLGSEYDKTMIERYNETLAVAEIDRLRRLSENKRCADCDAHGTQWASVNLGVFLCIKCGSHHRGIGTHISKPKGCTGTYLWGPDEVERMQEVGNKHANQIYGGSDHRPLPNAPDGEWRRFLVDKYERHRFAPKNTVMPAANSPPPPPQADLMVFDEPTTRNDGRASTTTRVQPPPVDFFSEFGL